MGLPAFAPHIDMAVHDARYSDVDIHYATLSELGHFFGREMPVHSHDGAFQLHYLHFGTVRVHVGDRVWMAEAPAFFLVPPGIAHGFSYRGDSEGHVLTVRQNLLWPLLTTELGSSVERQFNLPLLVGTDELSDRSSAPLTTLLDLLAREYHLGGPGRDQALDAYIRLVFLEVLRLAPVPPSDLPAGREDVRIYRAFTKLVEAQYQNRWLVSQYAAALGTTEGRLTNICKRMSARGPKKIVAERLVREAKQRLLHTNAQISEIAYELGFKDPAYFCRMFGQIVGKPPSDFRRMRSYGPREAVAAQGAPRK